MSDYLALFQRSTGTARLVTTYFNWIWTHSRKENTAAMRAGLATAPWNWHDLISAQIIQFSKALNEESVFFFY